MRSGSGLGAWAAAAIVILAAGCRSAAPRAAVSGTATYRERIAPPPGAVFEAVIEDVSRADAPATVVGTTRIDNAGSPPYAFSIPYDPATIDERGMYSVRARILAGDRLLFTTDRITPVITRGNPATVTLLMRSAGAPPAPPARSPEGPTWTLTRLGGTPVTVADGQQAPDLTLDAPATRAAGSSGCNRFTGGYRLEADRLTFGALATTRRMCPEGMDLEQRYLAALGRVATWYLEDGRLLLRDALGTTVAEFTRREGR
ncbi:MAG: YbaY family lipoprotein [Acidobacteriota bacterium]